VTPALAVNPNLDYVKVKQHEEFYYLAKTTLKILDDSPYEIVEEMKGQELVGRMFVPHYDYYKIATGEKAFEIIPGDFVTADEGTGVVTIAAYGEEDLAVMKELNVHIEMHLDEEGTVKSEVPLFGGMYYLKANKAVDQDLLERGLVYKTQDYSHNVPLCWRCHTRLYYAPMDAWYVNVQDLKEKLKNTNEQINWFPKHFKYGRFLKSLENAPDWNISRNRYWGSPVPVWECECGERFVPGSIKELEERSGQQVKELHRPEIDEVVVDCVKCGKKAHRVAEVLDSWIEAGSASFAERHFPFNTEEKLEDFFPPDFIAEYTGQIRAWFYVLHVIGGALYDAPAFKNAVVEGVILGTDGRKMSKNYGNYPDPKELLQKYGADALRLYLLGSPVMHGEDIIISEEQYRNQVRGTMLILWNVYNFFIMNAELDSWQPQKNATVAKSVLDTWILSLLHRLTKEVTVDLDTYDTANAIDKMHNFVNDVSTWYTRRSRDRVGLASQNAEDREAFYQTMYEVLVTLSKLLAPIAPFIAESMYKNLTDEESVHLTDWPIYDEHLISKELEAQMIYLRKIVEFGHAKRKEQSLKVRQPLAKIVVKPSTDDVSLAKDFEYLITEELNVKAVEFTSTQNELEVVLDTALTQPLIDEGKARDIIRSIQEERKKLSLKPNDKISVVLPTWPEDFEEDIKRKTLVVEITKGDTMSVVKVE
jgi:isoleucyl-tRNA synthetase